MKKILAVSLLVGVLLNHGVVVAEKQRPWKFLQGGVTEHTGDRIVLNEHLVINITGKTRVFNSYGHERDLYYLRGHKWLYVEGKLREDGSIDAERIYLLPDYIERKDRHRYPFMKLF